MNRLISILLLLFAASGLRAQDPLQTFYESSGGTRTPRYDSTMAWCQRLDKASPMISLLSFGKSPQGRDLPLLVFDRQGLTDPAAIHASGRTLLLIQACIHAGECEGKDAGMMLLRDLAFAGGKGSDPELKGLSDGVSVLFIPIFNVDGHERFGPWNRINQNGPVEMGWRTTAQNLNLNRDFLKADAPEMQQWLRMFNRWMPDFFIDTHTTDGADYQYVLTYQLEIHGTMDPGLTSWAKDVFLPDLTTHLNRGGYPIFPYVEFRNWHDPRSGLVTEAAPPMLSQGYTALRNCPGLLIETHMLKPYRQRVEATYECLKTSMEVLAAQSSALNRLVGEADRFVSSEAFRREPFPLKFETRMDDSTMVDFLGVSYSSVKSDLSGGEWFTYGKTPETMRLPFFSDARPVSTVELPYAYIIPPQWESVIERLRVHGVRMLTLRHDTVLKVRADRFRNPAWQQLPYEGRHPMTHIEFDETEELQSFPAGSAVVRVMQPAGRIIPHILEPDGNGSYLYWGFFDAIFEQKEYGESYVIEPMAREMLAADPALKAEFEAKMKSDPAFASNPWNILNWFYGKSNYADNRKNLYPVGKIFDPAVMNLFRP